ncbi:MAG: ABC transporter permease [Bilophila wadsworthia]
MAYKEVSVKQPLLLTILPYVSIIIFFAFWEGVVRSGIIPNTLLASPSQVFAAFIDKLSNPNPDGAIMATHAWTSIQEAFIGYVLSLVVGIPLGLAMGWFNVVEGLFRPIFELIRPIPPIAWIPLTVFWFGIGLAGKVFIIWIAGIVPCVINSYVGVRMTNPTLIQMARTYGAKLADFHAALHPVRPSHGVSAPAACPGLLLDQPWPRNCWPPTPALASSSLWVAALGRPDIIVLGMICVGLSGAVIGFIIDQIEKKLLAGIRR